MAKSVKFECLEIGDTFKYNGRLYVKIQLDRPGRRGIGADDCLAVCINDGMFAFPKRSEEAKGMVLKVKIAVSEG